MIFSDLVGSTALSARMDPEDLREVISAYQKCVAETVSRLGGFVAKYMGDGVLIYFGYPQAHEDDAERAVRAGLELVAAVGALKTHAPLQTRVGIATGLVVVGDLIGSGASQEQAIVGETPNLAARLQGIAEPNSVVIAESTRKLLGNLFELEDLGAQDLKGISSPVRAWAALRPALIESRFEALHATGVTELVGREEELEILLRRWLKAKSGEGQKFGFFNMRRWLSLSIGAGTRIWALAHVLPGAVIGRDCNVCDHTFIENDVVVGNRVTIKCGVQLWDGITIEDDVFIGPNATFTNDPFPRSKHRPKEFSRTVVKRGASIGANATVLPGVSIGERAMVGAGSVVTHSVPPLAIVAGNPARITGYDGARVQHDEAPASLPREESTRESRVRGVILRRLPSAVDMRGQLAFGEIGQQIPFAVRRFFLVYGVPSKEVRGEHAHRQLHQFLACIHGCCSVMADDGENREEFRLDDPSVGLYLPPLVWGVQYKYTPDAVMLVLASEPYDAGDYIRDYADFLAALPARTAV